MRINLTGYLVAGAVCLGSVTNGIAAGGTFTRACAARDLQIMIVLDADAVSAQELSDALLTIVDARMMCFDGQVMEALALYDRIAESLASSKSPQSASR
jgi:hypothetical protein